jgi:hypothetical protein
VPPHIHVHTAHPPRAVRRCLATVLAAAVVLGGAPAATAGTPLLAPGRDPSRELAALKKRAATLEKEYRGDLEILSDTKRAAMRATDAAERRSREPNAARSQIRALAANSYINGASGTESVVLATNGASVEGAAAVEYLARNNNRQIQSLGALADAAGQARRAARSKLDAVRRELHGLEKERARVKKLLAKYNPETPSGGGRPDGVQGKTKSPLIGTYMTARMRKALLEIDSKYGPFPAIGCYRAGDPQDHGSGRACDFMESTAGRMPTVGATAHGDAVSQYAISNASRLGIKYIIWRQRIYDMRSPGRRQMEDRGGVTANHYDHPHISVF